MKMGPGQRSAAQTPKRGAWICGTRFCRPVANCSDPACTTGERAREFNEAMKADARSVGLSSRQLRVGGRTGGRTGGMTVVLWPAGAAAVVVATAVAALTAALSITVTVAADTPNAASDATAPPMTPATLLLDMTPLLRSDIDRP